MYCAAELSPPLTSRYPERKTDLSIGQSFMPENATATKLMNQLKEQIATAYADIHPECILHNYPCQYLGPVKQLPMVGKLDALHAHVRDTLYGYIKASSPPTLLAADSLEIESSYHKVAKP